MDLSAAAKGILRAVAPTAASYFGTPLAGMAVKSVLDKWLGPEMRDNAPKVVEQAILSMSPEQALALQRADQEFAVQMESLGIKAEELRLEGERVAMADRASAREREIKTGDWTPRILAGLVVLGYGLVQWYVLSHVITPEMRELVMRSLGVLDVSLGVVLTYYFGSSAGSKQKTDTMAQMASGRRRVP